MTISEAITQVLTASHIGDQNFRSFLLGDDPEVVAMRKALVQLADAVRGEDKVRIRATSALGWPTWLVEVGEPIDMDGSSERPVKFINASHRATIFSQDEAESLMPFVLKVRPDAEIVPCPQTANQ